MLVKEGFRVVVESGAGSTASFTDAAYKDAGATVVDGDDAWKADIVVKVHICDLHARFDVFRFFHVEACCFCA